MALCALQPPRLRRDRWGKTHSFHENKDWFICQISYERRGENCGICRHAERNIGFYCRWNQTREALLSDISARRSGGSSLDRCPRICDINVLDGNERESDREGEIRDGEMKEVADDLIGL